MKFSTAMLSAAFLALTTLSPALAGMDYFGQKPPGMTPEKFAAGTISTDGFELNSVFSPDGETFMFTRRENDVYHMYVSHKGADGWTAPELSSLTKAVPDHHAVDMMFSRDGKQLFFISNRPVDGYPDGEFNIWVADWADDDWGAPRMLSAPISQAGHELYPMTVADGSLYFSAEREGGFGDRDHYRIQAKGGTFGPPENLGPNVNSPQGEGDLYVAADESLMIHNSSDRPGGVGKGDLYVSFKDDDGNWTKDQHLGHGINSEETDYCPMLTPDGKYLFFSRAGDIYWVDARVLDEYRPGT